MPLFQSLTNVGFHGELPRSIILVVNYVKQILAGRKAENPDLEAYQIIAMISHWVEWDLNVVAKGVFITTRPTFSPTSGHRFS